MDLGKVHHGFMLKSGQQRVCAADGLSITFLDPVSLLRPTMMMKRHILNFHTKVRNIIYPEDWVATVYYGAWYTDQVIQTEDEDIHINFMHDGR